MPAPVKALLFLPGRWTQEMNLCSYRQQTRSDPEKERNHLYQLLISRYANLTRTLVASFLLFPGMSRNDKCCVTCSKKRHQRRPKVSRIKFNHNTILMQRLILDKRIKRNIRVSARRVSQLNISLKQKNAWKFRTGKSQIFPCGQRDARPKVKRPCQCCFSTVEVKSAQEAD